MTINWDIKQPATAQVVNAPGWLQEESCVCNVLRLLHFLVLVVHCQVRQAYQAKGWVLNNLSGIEQCKNDGYLQSLKDQEGEGCHIWGMLTVRLPLVVGCACMGSLTARVQ